MNPNSQNQRWSKWTITIFPGWARRPTFEEVKLNAARFGRELYRSASEMRVQEVWTPDTGKTYRIEVLTEGIDVHDPELVARVERQWLNDFAIKGFGPGTTLTCEAKLMAGSRQDGTPTDQLIIAPPVSIH